MTPSSKDKKSPKDDSSHTSVDSKAYEKKVAREKERDSAWLNDAQWRRDILCGRQKKETSPTEQPEGNVNGHNAEAKVALKEPPNEPVAPDQS